MGNTVASGAERIAAYRDRRRRKMVQFRFVELSEDDAREAADAGYPLIVSEDQGKSSAELSRFISDMIACLDRTG